MRSDVSGGSVLNNVAAPQVHIDKMTTVPAAESLQISVPFFVCKF